MISFVPGVVLIVQDGECKSDSIGCNETYQTLPAGIALTITSGLLLTASVTLHVVNLIRRRSEASRFGVGLALNQEGGILELSASF